MPTHLTDDRLRFSSKRGGDEGDVRGQVLGKCLSMNRHYFNGVSHPTVDTVRQLLKEYFTPAERRRIACVIEPLFRIGSGRMDARFDEIAARFEEEGALFRARFDFIDRADLLVDWIEHRVRALTPYYGAQRSGHLGHDGLMLESHNPETAEEYEARVHDFTVIACELALFIVRSSDMARLPRPLIGL